MILREVEMMLEPKSNKLSGSGPSSAVNLETHQGSDLVDAPPAYV